MRNARIAEWILALVTTKDRAAATVGDLMEQAGGLMGFWLGVLGTAWSTMWLQFRAEKLRMLLTVALAYVFAYGLGKVLLEVEHVTRVSRWFGFEVVGNLAAGLLLGLCIALLARGREVAACLAFVAVHLTVLSMGTAIRHHPGRLLDFAVNVLEPYVAIFAGAILVRVSILRRHAMVSAQGHNPYA